MAKKLIFMTAVGNRKPEEVAKECMEAFRRFQKEEADKLAKENVSPKQEQIDNGLLELADDDPQLGTAWWLHESGQVQAKLSRAEVDKINNYVRNDKTGEMWEIGYDD